MTLVEVPVAHGRVIAVPAVHFRWVFARAVREAFNEEPPGAVAVELGPGAAANLAAWIRELRADSRFGARLPYMLGLLRPNRRLHPKHMDTCVRLQELHGVPIHEIPPAVLRQEVNYSALSLICVATTDSIIEAVRCSVENGIELYGVDLEDFAPCERGEVFVEDPTAAKHDLAAFVSRNGRRGAASRDPLVDGRRERVMASRLKALAERHGTVLFTGGLGHWAELERLLRDPLLPSAAGVPHVDEGLDTRALIDPALAMQLMDQFPDHTSYYESVRDSVDDRPMADGPDVRLLELEAAYDEASEGPNGQPDGSARGRFDSFLSYLDNSCLMSQQLTPGLSSVLAAAAAIVSEEFARRLGHRLVAATQIDWLQPSDMPELPYLRAVPFAPAEKTLASDCRKVELVRPSGRLGPFYLDNGVRREGTVQIESLFQPDGEGREGDTLARLGRPRWVWPPCESLLHGTAYQIAEQAHRSRGREGSEPYCGDLHAGIDVKATLRAATRTAQRRERRVYVRLPARGYPMSLQDALTEPFVFVFQTPQWTRSMKGVSWELSAVGRLQEHNFRAVEAREAFHAIRAAEGGEFLAAVHFAEDRELPAHLAPCKEICGLKLLWGTVAFGNPCVNTLQGARWLESSRFECSPVLRIPVMDELVRAYEENHGVSLDLDNWPEALIRLAIPYARRRVLVMAPDRSVVTQRAHGEARKRGLEIDVVPLSFISADRIDLIRHQYNVRPLDDNATRWPPEAVNLLGPSDAHLDLLPHWVRSQTYENG